MSEQEKQGVAAEPFAIPETPFVLSSVNELRTREVHSEDARYPQDDKFNVRVQIRWDGVGRYAGEAEGSEPTVATANAIKKAIANAIAGIQGPYQDRRIPQTYDQFDGLPSNEQLLELAAATQKGTN